MKNKYKKRNMYSLNTWRQKTVMTVMLTIFGAAITHGQVLIDEDFTGQALPTGWSNTNNGGTAGQIWEFDNPYPRTITGGNPGFDADFAILDSDNYGSSGNQDAYLETPPFDASGTGTLILSFDQQSRICCGASEDVEVWDGTSWTNVLSISSSDGYPNPANHKSIEITSAAGGAVDAKVRFHYVGDWDYWWAIDNVKVSIVSCLTPTGLSSANITASTADISWNASSSAPANGYEYYYSTSVTPPSAATTASGATTGTTVNISLLSDNTQYYFWVRSICSATDQSDWSQAATFHTLCNTENIPYTVPLSTVSTPDIPDCMTIELINTWGSPWYTEYYPGSGFTDNTLVSAYTYSGDGQVDNWVYTNGLNLTGGNVYQLHYRYGNNSTYYTEKLAVKFGTSPSSSAMTYLLTDHNNINDATPHDTTVYFMPAVTGTYYIGFHAYSDENQYYLYLDNISVDAAPSCNAPTGLSAGGIGSNSAILSWAGSSDDFVIEYGPGGFSPGNGTSVAATSSPKTINGLSPNTNYDFYLRSVCIPGLDTSNYSAVGSFTTLCNTPAIALGNDTAICEGHPVTLNAGNPGSSYLWNNGTTAQTLIASANGSYSVRVTNVYNCIGYDTISITVNPNPIVDLGPDVTLCEGASAELDAGNPGCSYLWNTTATTQTLSLNSAGLFFVTVKDAHHCVGTDTIQIMTSQSPVVYGINALQNANGSFNFNAAGGEYILSYLWDFGDGTGTDTAAQPNHNYIFEGNYLVTLVVANDCGIDTVTTPLHYNGVGVITVDLKESQLMLYPNPAKDRLVIRNTSNYEMKEVTVFNILGQVVFNRKIAEAYKYQMDIPGFATGIYNVKIKMNSGAFFIRKFEVVK